MPLRLSIYPPPELCAVRGSGSVTRAEIEDYLAETIREGAKGYAKLIDLRAATLELDHDDLETVAQDLVQYGWGERAGPVAMVVATPLTLDMAVLLKQRVGDRPFRIFTDIASATDWLASYQQSYRDDASPLRLEGRALRHLHH